MVNLSSFDAIAQQYDTDFTQTPLGRLLRQRVWSHLAQQFIPGQHVLELACGTGEDAVWLAQQGITVTATDSSAQMVRLAMAKAQKANVAQRLQTHQLALQEVANGQLAGQQYDGVLSNFGGLNTLADWRPLAVALAALVRPGGKAVLVPMGPVCPWEIGWHGGHGEWSTAVRRFHATALATIGTATIPITYPSAARLRRDFAPWFRHGYTHSLGLWLPPSYLGHLVNRWPRLFARLDGLEQRTAWLTRGWGDHYLLVLERHQT